MQCWKRKTHGPAFVEFLKKNYRPFDVLFAIAEKFSIVLLNGSGFAGEQLEVVVQAGVTACKAQVSA